MHTPLGVQILSISCSFWENLAKLYVSAPPGELVPPPWGNPGSATAIVYFTPTFRSSMEFCGSTSTSWVSPVKVWIRNFIIFAKKEPNYLGEYQRRLLQLFSGKMTLTPAMNINMARVGEALPFRMFTSTRTHG